MTKAEKTRQFIIEQTAPIFNMKGYSGTSMSDLTEATGLTKGSIYGNFENKDEVALAAFDHNLRQVSAVLKAELDKQTSARDRLLVFPRVYRGFLSAPFPTGGCPILNTAVEADDTHPQLKQKAAEAITAWKRATVKIINGGIAAKEFKAGCDAEQAALTIISGIEGAIMICKLTGRLDDFKKIMSQVENYINEL